jgi:hypothetical protein
MRPPPYELDVRLNPLPGSLTYEIVLFAEQDDEEPPAEDDYAGSAEVIELFVAAVNAQLFFRGMEGGLAPASLELLESSWDAEALALRYRLRGESVPPDSFLVLLALLAQTHHAFEPLRHVSLRVMEEGAGTLDAPGLLAKGGTVPTRIDPLPFDVHPPDPDQRKNFEIRLTFRAPLSAEQYESVQEALNVWDYLVLLGGFRFDFEPAEGLGNLGRINHESPRVVRLDLDRWPDAHFAFDAVFNLGAQLHASGLALETITVE